MQTDTSTRTTAIIAVASMVFLGAGCVHAPEYQPPMASGNSVLHFSTQDYKLLQFYENGNNCTEARGVKPGDNPLHNADRSMVVPANKQVAVTLIWSGIGASMVSSCHVTLSFKLPPDSRYRILGSVNAKGCSAQIVNLSSGQVADPSSINLMQMKKNSPLGFMHDGCVRVQ